MLRDYQNIIKKLKVGWHSVPADRTGSMFDRQRLVDRFFAFSKEKVLQDEARLIKRLAERLGFAGNVGASDADVWIGETARKVYLWVKEDVFDEFKLIFKFCCERDPSL